MVHLAYDVAQEQSHIHYTPDKNRPLDVALPDSKYIQYLPNYPETSTNRTLISQVMQTGRLREHLGRISMETVPRLSYLLQRPLVRIARETQRLSKGLGMCTKQEVSGSLRIVLAPALADSCVKACHR